jgi:ATP-dependent Zn protease
MSNSKEVELTSPEGLEIAAAYHEAGHVVVGLHLGLKLQWATIVPNKEFVGRVQWHPIED